MVRIICRIFSCLLVFTASVGAFSQKKVSRDGYVTHVDPPTSFQLNRQRVVITPSTKLMLDATTPTVEENFTFSWVFPGKRVIVNGVEDAQTPVLTAKSIEVFAGATRLKIDGTAYEDRESDLVKEGSGWTGKVYTDGYEMSVNPKTYVQLLPGRTTLDPFRSDIRVEYHAERQRDGSLLASQIKFSLDDEVNNARKFRQTSQFKIDPPDYDKKIPRKVHFFLQSFQILPDRQLQDLVQSIGLSLVPAWQRQLPDSDPAKITFRFYVLKKAKGLNRTFSNDSGTVFIPAQVLPKLQNEAQLAALLSADIAGVIQSDGYQSRMQKRTQQATDIAMLAVPLGFAGQFINDGAFSAGYWSPLVEHEYRIGLRYLMAAGYDPRQAPIALQRISERHPDNKSDQPFTSFANSLDMELGFDYEQVDFSMLRTGETEYSKLLDLLLAADPKMKDPGKTRMADE